ncbi:serine protease [Streptomyces sp. CA-243310]|uniref:serine protease n=1 Tax=Streptomyces sp. CA-243310 TaxID=3240056 RepID=UPI003D90736B
MTELVRICDLAGRVRGSGFVADDRGTVITSHEAVDGLARVVLHGPGERTWLAEAGDVTPLPWLALALVRTDGLGLRPLPIGARSVITPGTYVRIPARGWRQARVLAAGAEVTYTATDRFHVLPATVELAIGTAGRDALELGGEACGGPVLDAETGAVLAVVGTALHAEHRSAGFAIPLRGAAEADPGGPLAALLERNAATVPGHGADLNLAGALELTATTLPPALTADGPEPVERPEIAAELAAFTASDRSVLGLVGAPGTGRTTALAVLTAHRARGARPAPTLWLRGADLRPADSSLADAAARALAAARRIVAAGAEARTEPEAEAGTVVGTARVTSPECAAMAGAETVVAAAPGPGLGSAAGLAPFAALAPFADAGRRDRACAAGTVEPLPGLSGRPGPAGRAGTAVTGPVPAPGAAPGAASTAERIARLAADAGCALLVVLDAPEEASPRQAPRQAPWAEATARWLDDIGARLVVAARPEYWERAGGLYPPEALHTPARPARRLPPALPVGDLTPEEARTARARLGIPADAVREADARHPLTLRLLADIRAAEVTAGRPGRDEVFAAHLDLSALRVAVRIAASGAGPSEPGQGGAPATPPGTGGTGGSGPGWFGGLGAAGSRLRGAGVPSGPDTAGGDGVSALTGSVCGADPDAEERGAPGARSHGHPGRGAHGPGVHGPGVRRLAARVAGRVHEAARRCLGPGQGELDRAAFEELFPWRTGWASAVLAEGLLVPAGNGYRFAHEELSDWLQAGHLDVPTALNALVHLGPATTGPPVPRHRVGTVLEALLRLSPTGIRGALTRLVEALNSFAEAEADRQPDRQPDPQPESQAEGRTQGERERPPPGEAGRADRVWWAARLLRDSLLRVPDATPYLPVLHALAEHVARTGPGDFEGWFWNRLRLSESDRLDLLRRLLPCDHRYLEAAARRLARDPRLVQPLLCGWLTDERRLRGRPGATVATAAQALLHTHRALAVDELAEALVAAAHPRADELLAVLAEDEPSALCRAVDRWAHDERPGRRVAAAAYGLTTAPHVRAPADRELLRRAAQALLARPADATLHGSALGMLLRDPQVRARYLPDALACFRDPEGGARLPASALVAALPVLPDPDAVFVALRARADGEVVRALAALTTPGLARRAGDLVREHLARHPGDAPHAAVFVDRRLDQGLTASPVLRPLVLDLLRTAPTGVRVALARVLAAPGGKGSSVLRGDLADVLLREESDPVVLDAFLGALADWVGVRPEERTRELLRRTGRRLLGTPGGPAVFEQRTVELARADPVFGSLVARWLGESGAEAAALLGPGARRTVETLSRAAPDIT